MILGRHQRWCCPNCDVVAFTKPVPNRYHLCVGLKGVLAPLVPEGVNAKVEAYEREDYVGDDLVRCDAEGRPIMSVRTTRDDNEDVTVFAPTAKVRVL